MKFSLRKVLTALLLINAVALTGCEPPDLKGGGIVTDSTVAGIVDVDGKTGFGVYAKGDGKVVAGTRVCLYTDQNNDGKVECSEVGACASKDSGESDYVGAIIGSSGEAPSGFMCGTIKTKGSDGQTDSESLCHQSDPDNPVNVCDLEDCCPCVDCGGDEEAEEAEPVQNGALGQISSISAKPKNPHNPIETELLDSMGQLKLRVVQNANGRWTITAGHMFAADTIERRVIAPDGSLVTQETLNSTFTSEGIEAKWKGDVPKGQYTVFSVRAGGQPVINYYLDRGASPDLDSNEDLLQAIDTAVWQ